MDSVASFVAKGSPTSVSNAIETFARAHGHVTALVVPWESTPATLSMAVTAVKIDGWAIEHTNLGTITLTAIGAETTRVAIEAPDQTPQAEPKLAAVFDRFAQHLQKKLATVS